MQAHHTLGTGRGQCGWRGQSPGESWVGLGRALWATVKTLNFTLSETEATGALKQKGDMI